jgi:hypothetical protein
MDLPEDDEAFLRNKGYAYKLIPDGEGACLVIEGYPVNPEVYDRPETDLMIRIPAQFNIAALDNYYVDPPIRLKTGGYPPAADHFEDHAGRKWQRFSRHLPRPWRAGVDGLQMFFGPIFKELQSKG